MTAQGEARENKKYRTGCTKQIVHSLYLLLFVLSAVGVQMKSVITTILPRFRILPTAAPVTYNVSLTLFVKDGLFVRVAPR